MTARLLHLVAVAGALASGVAAPAQTILLSNGFNSAWLPAGWSTNYAVYPGTGSNPILSFVTSSIQADAKPCEGASFVKFNSYDCRSGAKIRLESPVIDASGSENLSVQFAWFQDSRTNYDGEGATLQWTTNDWAATNNVLPFQMRRGTPTNWVVRHLALPPQAISTDLRVGLLFNSQFGNNCYMDDFRVYASPAVASYPCGETFENGFGVWSCGPGADFAWTRWSGRTPSGDFPGQTTGVSAAQSGSSYLYVEASDPNFPAKTAILEAPFDFSRLADPRLGFHYHMCGSSMGSLHVETSTDGGASWSAAWSQSGQQQANETDPWGYAEVVLTHCAWQPDARIRFRGVTGSGGLGDMALDTVSILNDLCGGLDDAVCAGAGAPIDGTHVPAGATFTKTWTMSNSGSTAWASNSQHAFAFGGGDNPASSSAVHFAAAESVAPGGVREFSVTFVAPTNGGICAGFWSLRREGVRFGERVWLDVVVDAPDIAITNAQTLFASTAATAGLGGEKHSTVVGAMRWTNALTGGGGTFAAGSPWSVSGIALAVGDNPITVSGTNSAGVRGGATIVLTRLAAPEVAIATPDTTVPAGTQAIQLEGTAGAAAIGDLLWENSLGGAGSVPVSAAWSLPGISLAVGTNVVTVAATNAAGESVFDDVRIVRPSRAASGALIDEPFDASPAAPAGWTFGGIAENYATATNSGRAVPSVKFDTAGDVLTSPAFSGGTNLQFWMRANPTTGSIATGTFVVAQSIGGSWSTLDVVTNPAKAGLVRSLALSPSATRLRFTWNKVYGNLAFDDVIVTGPDFRPLIEAAAIGSNDVEIVFEPREDGAYQLMFTENLATGVWTEVDAATVAAGAGITLTHEGGGDHEAGYYRIQGVAGPSAVVWGYVKRDKPGKSKLDLVGIPFQTEGQTLASLLDPQAFSGHGAIVTRADQITLWDAGTQTFLTLALHVSGTNKAWKLFDRFEEEGYGYTNPVLPSGSALWFRNSAAAGGKMSIAGEVVMEAAVTNPIQAGLQLLSNPFSDEVRLGELSIHVNATGHGAIVTRADQVTLWDAGTQAFLTLALHVSGTNKAWKLFERFEEEGYGYTNPVIRPGQGFWFRSRNAFNWVETNKYRGGLE